MWQTKYSSAVPKNLGLRVDFRPCIEGDFLTRRLQSVPPLNHLKNIYFDQRKIFQIKPSTFYPQGIFMQPPVNQAMETQVGFWKTQKPSFIQRKKVSRTLILLHIFKTCTCLHRQIYTMAIRVVEFSNGWYKIIKISASESTYSKEINEF